jgi:hypothetical protein
MSIVSVRSVFGHAAGSIESARSMLSIPRPASLRQLAELQTLKNHEISLRYVGFYCFGETDELSASDEPYFTFGIAPILVEKKNTLQTQIYENVDSGESRGDLIEIYRGLPLGAAISITLAEHDEGDPNKYRDNVERAVDRSADKILEGLANVPVVGVALNVLGEILFVLALPALTDFINDLLGTEDDTVGTVGIALTPNDMMSLSTAERQNFHGIQAHLESLLISGDGASYKAYFDVVG